MIFSSRDNVPEVAQFSTQTYIFGPCIPRILNLGQRFSGLSILAKLTLYVFLQAKKRSVVDVCCVFWPAFRCSQHLKAGWTTFLSFSTFLNLLQWFHAWNQQKTSENEQKKGYLSTPQCWSTHWGDPRDLSLFGWFFYMLGRIILKTFLL